MILPLTLALTGCAHYSEPERIFADPHGDLQAIIDRAALSPRKSIIQLRPGIYRPRQEGQALIYLNRAHDGIQIEGSRDSILTAKKIFPDGTESAVVNHVVYIGDGVTQKTRLSGFRITGAQEFVTEKGAEKIEPNRELRRRYIFYADGGGIKIFGDSSPILEDLEIYDNQAILCGGGISIEHQGRASAPAIIRRNLFRNNRAYATGAAVDVLPGSRAVIADNVFIGNKLGDLAAKAGEINRSRADLRQRLGLRKKLGFSEFTKSDIDLFRESSALTVFGGSEVRIQDNHFSDNSGTFDVRDEVFWYWSTKAPPVPGRIEILGNREGGGEGVRRAGN